MLARCSSRLKLLPKTPFQRRYSDAVDFSRPKTKDLRATVTPAGVHIFVSMRNRFNNAWPYDFGPKEVGDKDAELVVSVKKTAEACGAERPMVTAYEETSRWWPEYEGRDIIIYPHNIMLKNVTDSDMQQRITQVLQDKETKEDDLTKTLKGEKYIFVCTHGNRDARCGHCGPALVYNLQEEINKRGIEDVYVRGCSHVGGHAYAGNVLMYPQMDWFGYVSPEHVKSVIDHSSSGKAKEEMPEDLKSLWRGNIHLNKDEQKEFYATLNQK
ncbi:hypothetical protein PROFUN_12470 [Planoprotostelium fungivorum]|uniref:Sucraseferredoxin family protein n=1 Tax=Planoprotostelium fungivorum TaxID=1890364 RepID=A0A2P6N7D3_9EUKA|nr:hypothetical protein PROFUN_12470 [Planoprotostelium fungivorum]